MINSTQPLPTPGVEARSDAENLQRPSQEELAQRVRILSEFQPSRSLLIHGRSNIRYLTGYEATGFAPWLLIRGGEMVLVHYTADEDSLRSLAGWIELVPFGPSDDETAAVVSLFGSPSTDDLSGDLDWWTGTEYKAIRDVVGDRLNDCGQSFSEMRRCKSSWEKEQLRNAGRITDSVMRLLVELAQKGASARELAAHLHESAIRMGSGPFPPIPFVAVGGATFLNHSTWDASNEKAGPYLLEFATSVNGYGVPLSASATRDANGQRALAAIGTGLRSVAQRMGPGVQASVVDSLMRQAIAAAGFELRHRSGYAIGLGEPDTWMEGRIARLSPNATYPLATGMAFHVVGSVVQPGSFGVAQSMSVLVTDDGIEHIAGPIFTGEMQ
jgi:Xaa-Pro dipeptidase